LGVIRSWAPAIPGLRPGDGKVSLVLPVHCRQRARNHVA
jgi:hypothetical protein